MTRAGAADSYHQSRQITQELGDRAGIATTTSQLGLLRSDQNRAAEAVGLHMQALTIHLQLGVSQARISVRAMAELRSQLGSRLFNEQSSQTLDEESLANLPAMLDAYDTQQSS